MISDKFSLFSSSWHMSATRFDWAPHARNTLFTTSFGVCTQKEIVTLWELINPLLCIEFHYFHNGQTVTPLFAFLSQHVIAQTVGSQHSWGLLSEWMIHEFKIVGHFKSTDQKISKMQPTFSDFYETWYVCRMSFPESKYANLFNINQVESKLWEFQDSHFLCSLKRKIHEKFGGLTSMPGASTRQPSGSFNALASLHW